MIILRMFLMGMIGISFGMLSAAGVFTVLAAIGMMPRFAGKTHTAFNILLYEDMVVYGTIFGCLLSIFSEYCQFGAKLQELFLAQKELLGMVGSFLQGIVGLTVGSFVGCRALAIAEMLQTVPIIARRVKLKQGLSWIIMGVAIGKVCGSILYFYLL